MRNYRNREKGLTKKWTALEKVLDVIGFHIIVLLIKWHFFEPMGKTHKIF